MSHRAQPLQRRRKAHYKSRKGCRNCKLRRVKCDESRPSCKQCLAYGVTCNAGTLETTGDLQPSLDDAAFSVKTTSLQDISANQVVLGIINASLRDSPFNHGCGPPLQLEMKELAIFDRFRTWTVRTMGTPTCAAICGRELPIIACQHSYVMHTLLATTLIHDRAISGPEKSPKQSAMESYHCFSSLAVFNAKLSEPIHPMERDAIWITAVLLGCVSLLEVDAESPASVWPLKPAAPADLVWITMSYGKRAIWKLTDPLRPDSLFRKSAAEASKLFEPCNVVESDFATLPPEFMMLYDLDQPTKGGEEYKNPYHGSAALMGRLMATPCNHDTILQYLAFTNYLGTDLRPHIEAKDPKALLLIAFWLGKVCEYKLWWMWRRSFLGCQSICLYLNKYHSDDAIIQKLVQIPWTMTLQAAPNGVNAVKYLKGA